jgi:hypothetical protein
MVWAKARGWGQKPRCSLESFKDTDFHNVWYTVVFDFSQYVCSATNKRYMKHKGKDDFDMVYSKYKQNGISHSRNSNIIVNA